MSALKQIETDIKEFLDKELKVGRIFLNEWDFQMNLTLFLTDIKKYKVYLEYAVPFVFCEKANGTYPFTNKENINIDIVIEKEGFFYPIELKYKTKKAVIEFERFGETKTLSLKDQSRIPMSRYDFWKDVARLEFLKNNFNQVAGGLCVFLTNNQIYTNKEKGVSEMFTMEKNKPHSGELKFKEGKLEGKNYPFPLLENYQIDKWYKVVNKETKITFHYCIVRVEKATVAVQLHKIFNSLERFDYDSLSDPEKNKRIPKKGVYIFFEKGEEISIPNGEKLDRIVRIGTHYNQEGLQERLKNHFTTSNSVFRENVKEALVKRYGNNITNEFINNYMRENFSFVILEDKEGDKEKRCKWEYKLTQTISKAVFLGEIIPSEKWLGKDAAFDEIIEGGLWQKEGIYNEFTSQDIIELRSIL